MTSIEGKSAQQKHNPEAPSTSFSDTKTGRSLLQPSTSLSYSAIKNLGMFFFIHFTCCFNINCMEQFQDLQTSDRSTVISIRLVEKRSPLQLPLLHGNDDVISVHTFLCLPTVTHNFRDSRIRMKLGRRGLNIWINQDAIFDCSDDVIFPVKEIPM